MSTLKVDNITGRGSTGFTGSVKSEGGNTTTDLQQGLCKMWFNADMTGTAGMNDSFNSGTLTDNGTGDLSVAMTNNMSSIQYCGAGSVDTGGSFTNVVVIRDRQTSSIRLVTNNSDSNIDFDPSTFQIQGDLA